MQVFATSKAAAGGGAMPQLTLNCRLAVRVMKITAMLLLIACMHVSARGLTQTITLTVKDAPLEQVFKFIKRQTNYLFFYRAELLKEAKKVTVEVKNMPLQQLLDLCFKDQPFTYSISGKYITIIPRKKEDIDKAEIKDIHGRVVNEKGEPVANVSVTIKGTNISTATDENGEFTLRSNDQDAVLVFTHVSMESFELKVSGQTELAISLKTKISELSDVSVIVSTGYQDIPKERATGSFVKISNDLLNRKVSTNILDRIYEVTSGLNFQPVSSRSNINIRGISTIFANDKPLIIIDGFPYSGDISNINPNDVDNISVLKDAAAASIWGVSSGNGVIVIKSKTGNFNQKSKVQISSNLTIGEKPDLFGLSSISSSDAIELERKLFNQGYYQPIEDYGSQYNYFGLPLPPSVELLIANRNGQLSDEALNFKITELQDHDVRNDIDKYIIRKTINNQHLISIAGGGEKISYYGSVGYDVNLNTNIGDKLSRWTIRLDNTYKQSKRLEVTTFITYTQNKNINNGINYYTLLPSIGQYVSPYMQLADESGTPLPITVGYRSAFVDTAHFPGLLDWHYIPLSEINLADNLTKQDDIRLGTGLKYTFAPGLNAEIKYQFQNTIQSSWNHYSIESFFARNLINQYVFRNSSGINVYPIPLAGILDLSNRDSKSWNFRGQVNYDRTWNHNQIIILGGSEIREFKSDFNKNRKYGYDNQNNSINPIIDYNSLFTLNGYGSFNYTNRIPSNEAIVGTVNRFISYYFNGAYVYKSKYGLSTSGRVDQSNFFGVKSKRRFIPLWSVGTTWELSKETFYNINWLPYIRFRATYGFNGNTNNKATAFATGRYLSPTSFSIIPVQYAEIISPPNPELRWEKIRISNFGIDFAAHKKRIDGSIDLYYKTGQDLITDISVDPTTGVQSFTGNNATIKGKGVDVVINTRNFDRIFIWNTNILFSYTSDKVVSYEATPIAVDLVKSGNVIDPVLTNSNTAILIGKPLLSVYNYKWAGLDPSTGDPRGFLSDTIANYNNVVSNAKTTDIVYNGPALPRVFGSIRNTFGWKNISLSINILYKLGYYFRRSSVNYSILLSNWNSHGDYSKRWLKPGDEEQTNVPSFSSSPNQSRDDMYLFSDVLVERGDHIRLQDIRIGYDFKNKNTKRSYFQNVQLYIYINNIGILWRANEYNLDPDFNVNNGIAPPRSISFGITANF